MPDYLGDQGQDGNSVDELLRGWGAVPIRAPRMPAFDAPARIRELAPQYGLDPDFVMKIGRQESGLQHYSPDRRVKTSPQGAVGVMQVLPATARKYGYDANDPEQNIHASLSELKSIRDRWGDDDALTLSGYHSGIEDAEKALRNPKGNPKTHNYLRSILGNDAYTQALARYSRPALNSVDDFLSQVGATPAPAGNSVDEFLSSVKSQVPKQIYADDLTKLANEKYGGDETKAATDLYNQGVTIMQRMTADVPPIVSKATGAVTPLAPVDAHAVPQSRTYSPPAPPQVQITVGGDETPDVKEIGRRVYKSLGFTDSEAEQYAKEMGATDAPSAFYSGYGDPLKAAQAIKQMSHADPATLGRVNIPGLNEKAIAETKQWLAEKRKREFEEGSAGWHEATMERLTSLSPEEKQRTALAIATKRPLTDAERQALGISSPPVIGDIGTVVRGAGSALGSTMQGFASEFGNPDGPIGEAGKYLSEQSRVRENLYGRRGELGEFEKMAGRTIPAIALRTPAAIAGQTYLESKGEGASTGEAATRAALSYGGLKAAGAMAGEIVPAVESTLGKKAVEAASLTAAPLLLESAAGRPPESWKDVGKSALLAAGLTALGSGREESKGAKEIEQSGRSVEQEPAHHSNFQPRDTDGTFAEGKPVVPEQQTAPRPLEEIGRAKPAADEPEFVARSRARLKESLSGSKLSANPVGALYDAAVVTGWELYQKARGFADWSKRMIDDLGPDVKDHLTHIWGQLEGESNKMFAESLNRPRNSVDEFLEQVSPQTKSALPQYDESVMDRPESNGRTSPLSTLDSYIRANILAGPSPITHKLGSLTASAITDEVARPFAAAVDAVRAKAAGGDRALFEDPRGLARATIAAVTKGIPEMGQILRKGYTPDQIARGELPYEIKGRPIIGDYINLVFRTYKAGVHPFEVFAYTRAMENQARVAAEAELKAGTIAPSEVAARATEIAKGQNVDPATAGQMELNASIAAADATFRADNPVSREWSKWRRSAGPRWTFVMNRAFEFMRTPINAVIKTVELTPGLGQAKELLTELRSKAKTGEWLPEDVDKARFAKAWGALPVGVGLFMLGSALHRRGLRTGFVDDHKRKGMDYAEGRTPGSLRIAPDTWLDVMRFSPPGVVMSMGATWDYYTNEKSPGKGTIKDAMSDLYHALMPAAESLPFMQNPKRIIDPRAQMAKLIPAYSTVRDFYRGNQSTIGKAVPPARWLFGQKGADVLGRQSPDQGFIKTVLHVRSGQPSVALDELRANGVTYSRPWRRPEESRKAYDARVKAQGESIEQRITDLKAAPQYQDGDDEFKRKALETAQLVSHEDAVMGRKPREGDAAVLLYNARVALQTRDLLRDLRQSEAYRRLHADERQQFERAIQQRMQGAHARISGEDSIGERISAAAGRFRELLADRGALVRDAVKRAHGGHQ
jgi:hypothetical protein